MFIEKRMVILTSLEKFKKCIEVMYPLVVFGTSWYIHKPLKKRGKKGYTKVHFTQISAKVCKRRKKGVLGKFYRQKRR